MTRYHKGITACSHFQFAHPPRSIFVVKKRGPNSNDILNHCVELLLYLIEVKKLCVWMEPQEVEHLRSINNKLDHLWQDILLLKQNYRTQHPSHKHKTNNATCSVQSPKSSSSSSSYPNDAPPSAIHCDHDEDPSSGFPYYSLPAGLYSMSIPVCIEEVEHIDFCITLGGDGTVLHLNWLLNHVNNIPLPPVLSFAMGTLGFLTSIYFEKYPVYLERILQCYPLDWEKHSTSHPSPISYPMNHIPSHPERFLMINPRMRLYCTVWRRVSQTQNGNNSFNAPNASPQPSPGASSSHWVQAGSYTVMNEVLIHRSASPFLTSIDIQLIEPHQQQQPPKYVTTVTGDGLMVSTPTGSTAYSMAAGGPMVAPSTQCMILTPVCAHSLSMRPIVLNSATDLRLVVSPNSRVGIYHPSTVESGHSPEAVFETDRPTTSTNVSSTSFAAKGSFDGHWEIHLLPGDYIQVTAARYSCDAINLHYPYFSNESLWLKSLTNKLHWNLTKQQLHMLEKHEGLRNEMEKGLLLLHGNPTAASNAGSTVSTPRQAPRPTPNIQLPHDSLSDSPPAPDFSMSDAPAEYDVDYRHEQVEQDYSNELPTSNYTNYADDIITPDKDQHHRFQVVRTHATPLLVGFGVGILSVLAFLFARQHIRNNTNFKSP